MFWALLPFFAAAAVTKHGFHQLRLGRSQPLAISLDGAVAVFLDLTPNSFTAKYARSASDPPEFLTLTEPSFSATGHSLTLTPVVARPLLRFWLLPERQCPNPAKILLTSTDNSLTVNGTVDGETCLFLRPGADFYSAQVQACTGLPCISFHSSRGDGSPFRVCRGETDICTVDTQFFLFMSFQNDMLLNLNLTVGRGAGAGRCGVNVLPAMQGGGLAMRAAQAEPLGPCNCARPLGEDNHDALTLVVGFAGYVFGAMAAAMVVMWLVSRRAKAAYAKWANGWLAGGIRRTYERC
jgi:hypothetical protein